MVQSTDYTLNEDGKKILERLQAGDEEVLAKESRWTIFLLASSADLSKTSEEYRRKVADIIDSCRESL